jgi:hypothetical protein
MAERLLGARCALALLPQARGGDKMALVWYRQAMAMRVSGGMLGRTGLVMAAVAMPMPALAQAPQISGDWLEFYRSMQGAQWATAQGNASVCTFTVTDRVEGDCMVKQGTSAKQVPVKIVYLADGSTETWMDGKNIRAGEVKVSTAGVIYDRNNLSYFRNGIFWYMALHIEEFKAQSIKTSLKLSEDMIVSISRTTQGSVVTHNVSYQVRVVNGDVAGAMARSRDAAAALGATANAQRILEMLEANPAAFMGDAPDRLRPLAGLIPGLAQDQAPVVAQPQPQQPPQVLPPKPVLAAITPKTPPSMPAPVLAPRFALVIGNARYGGTLAPLANPVRDADMVADALRATGFDVEVLRDADQRGMKAAIARFGQRMRGAGSAGTGLFYYAGHGAQARGVNYLIPVNAQLETEADLDLDSVSADAVLSQMSEAGVGTSVVILDACRNLPLARGARSADRGLARMDAPGGSYIAYSTAPGQTAADGAGANSPFATALVREIAKADEPIEILFRNVRSAVYEATGGKQTPWDSSSLFRSFVFRPSTP